MDDKKVRFLPFHAVNDFMRPEYRLTIIRETLAALPDLPDPARAQIDRITQKIVQVPGFRNSAKAPAHLRIKPTAEAFERNPQIVASILAAWAALHSDLGKRVYDLLIERNWEILSPEADRTKLPGFYTIWPKNEDFQIIYTAYQAKYPQMNDPSDDVSLMAVWISTRLPYQIDNEE